MVAMVESMTGPERPFGAAFRSLAQLFSTTSDAPAARRHLGEYTRTAADQVLGAEDHEHLLALLDDLSGDEAFWDDVSSAAEHAVERRGAAGAASRSEHDARIFRATLGATAAARCQAGDEALEAFYAEFTKILASIGAELVNATKVERRSIASMLHLLYDHDVPLFLRKMIARFLLALTSAMVISRAEERGERLAPWLALALAEMFAKPFEEALAAITSPQASTRLASSLGDDAQAQAKLSAALERWSEEAAASGKGAYFPVHHEAG
jgi:hypothetical protein